MITKRDIGFESEILENISVDDIRKQYEDGIIIWLHASGSSPYDEAGCFRCILDYKGKVKYLYDELPGATANQAMIRGAIAAVNCINSPKRIYLVAPTQLGFVGAFKGKGINCDLLTELLGIVLEKRCQITEVLYINAGTEIRRFIENTKLAAMSKEAISAKKEVKDYRQVIYEECINKVVGILESKGIHGDIISEIKELKPWD